MMPFARLGSSFPFIKRGPILWGSINRDQRKLGHAVDNTEVARSGRLICRGRQ